MKTLVRAIVKEIHLRRDYLDGEEIKTIYFGGGTPSILSLSLVENILDAITQNFRVSADAEVTMEANPDDLDREKLAGIHSLGINRLSVGIQTFDDEKLKFINRSHSSREALQCLENIRKAGFTNVSADLIFAIPPHDLTLLYRDLEQLIAFDLSHISVYGLTIEEPTAFGKWHKKGKFNIVSEQNNLEQYQLVIESLTISGYEHYEVSNFSKPGKYSQHNTSYWQGAKYLGIGPGAHSYDIRSRAYNVSNNHQYIAALSKEVVPLTEEVLTLNNRRNEYMMTRIRTKWGINLKEYATLFSEEFDGIDKGFITQLIDNQQAIFQDGYFHLTQKGWFLADEISARLFLED